eukprot:2348114-Amphidinium_carterae.2
MCVELEDVRAALADVIKEARNKAFSVGDTAWSRTPPEGLLDWITKVDTRDAEGLKALIARQTPQDLMRTPNAIFSDTEVDPIPAQTPEKRSRLALSSFKTSDSKTFDVASPSVLGDSTSLPSSPPSGVAQAGRVHARSAPSRHRVSAG